MIVVVDTNQFYGDPRMALRNFKVLLAQHEHGNVVVAIPEVVLQELPKMYRREYAEALEKVSKGLGKLRTLGQEAEIGPEPPNPDEAQESYATWLRAHLAERRIRMPALPAVTLAELVARSVAEQRPFRAESKGFRDALIWLTMLELAAEDTVIFISKNW